MKIINKLICLLFGHHIIIKDFYPNDEIITEKCYRCDKVLKQRPNVGYDPNQSYNFSEFFPDPYKQNLTDSI